MFEDWFASELRRGKVRPVGEFAWKIWFDSQFWFWTPLVWFRFAFVSVLTSAACGLFQFEFWQFGSLSLTIRLGLVQANSLFGYLKFGWALDFAISADEEDMFGFLKDLVLALVFQKFVLGNSITHLGYFSNLAICFSNSVT